MELHSVQLAVHQLKEKYLDDLLHSGPPVFICNQRTYWKLRELIPVEYVSKWQIPESLYDHQLLVSNYVADNILGIMYKKRHNMEFHFMFLTSIVDNSPALSRESELTGREPMIGGSSGKGT